MSHASVGFGVNHGVRDHLRIEDGTHEHAPAGILVVQVRRLGTIPRKVLDAAALLTLCAFFYRRFSQMTFKPSAIDLPGGSSMARGGSCVAAWSAIRSSPAGHNESNVTY